MTNHERKWNLTGYMRAFVWDFRGSYRVPQVLNGVHGRELHWELGNLQNPTQMLSYDGMNNQPLHLANIKFSSVESFFLLGRPNNVVDRRMGLREWMPWMWFAHNHTPSIRNALVTWINTTSYLAFNPHYSSKLVIMWRLNWPLDVWCRNLLPCWGKVHVTRTLHGTKGLGHKTVAWKSTMNVTK